MLIYAPRKRKEGKKLKKMVNTKINDKRSFEMDFDKDNLEINFNYSDGEKHFEVYLRGNNLRRLKKVFDYVFLKSPAFRKEKRKDIL